MPHIGWRDIIDLNFDHLHEQDGYSPEQIEAIEDRATLFLDTLEATEFGQEHFQRILTKFEDDKLNINFFNSTNDGWKDDNISLSVEYDWGFLDQRSNEFSLMTFERMMIHELVHAGDPRSPREPFAYNEDYTIATEEFATLETDRFARENMPHLGLRGAYDNAFDSDQPLNDKLREAIAVAVDTAQERMDGAALRLEQSFDKIEAELATDNEITAITAPPSLR